jgi:ATP-binding protein involved in chromosome partitioning
MMKITIEAIKKALSTISLPNESKHLVDSNAIKNINIFGDEVVIDLVMHNPALQAKKKTEVSIMKAIHDLVYEKAKVSVNISVVTPKKSNQDLIKGKPIDGIQNIIAVASGKGGVGKSTVTANLAVSLANMGFKVGVLDADIYGPSMPIMFDVTNERPLTKNVDGVSKMVPVENFGVKILSIGFFTKPDQAVIWRGPMASKALNQMIFDAHWGILDFLLIDLPPGTGDIHLSIMQLLPITGAVVVSTPQAVALSDAKKGVAMFQQKNIQVPVLGIIENMAYFKPEDYPEKKYYIFGQSGAKYLADDLKIPFLGELPLFQSIRESGDVGRPAAMQEKTLVFDAFTNVTRSVVQQLVQRNKQLPPTEAVKITTMAGCSAITKK